MEQLFNDLQRHIATQMGSAIFHVDEDYGQLEALVNGDDQYPVTFPCVLISQPETEWTCLGGAVQQGKCRLTVRLAYDCYDDTHYGSGQEEKVMKRMAEASRLKKNIHMCRFAGCTTPMRRTHSREYSLPGNIKVYEQMYETTVIDED